MNNFLAVLLILVSTCSQGFSQETDSVYYLELGRGHVQVDANLFSRKEIRAINTLLSNDAIQGNIIIKTFNGLPTNLPDLSVDSSSIDPKLLAGDGSLIILYNTHFEYQSQFVFYDFIKSKDIITRIELNYLYDLFYELDDLKEPFNYLYNGLEEAAHLLKAKQNTPRDQKAFNEWQFYYFQNHPRLNYKSDLFMALDIIYVSAPPIDSKLPGLKSLSANPALTITTNGETYPYHHRPDTIYSYYIEHKFQKTESSGNDYYRLDSKMYFYIITGKNPAFQIRPPNESHYHFFPQQIRDKYKSKLTEDRYRVLKEKFGMEYSLDSLLKDVQRIHVRKYNSVDGNYRDSSLVFSNDTLRLSLDNDQFETIDIQDCKDFLKGLAKEAEQSKVYDLDCYIGSHIIYFEGANNTYLGEMDFELNTVAGFGITLHQENYSITLGGAFLNDVSYIKEYLNGLFEN
jgi:hypothetical protein